MLEARRLLSLVTWSVAASGSWNTAADWTGGVVPQAGDDVVINQPGDIQVTLSSSTWVRSLSVVGDVLNISGGSLSVAANSSIGTSAALVLNNATLSLASGATLTNSGSITVNPGSALNDSAAYTETSTGVLTLPSGVAGTGVGTNLLGNAGFESPSVGTSTTTVPGTWGQWNSSYVSWAYAHGGSQSLVESGLNSGAYQSFSASAGVSYSASIYALNPAVNTLTGSEGMYLQIDFTNSSDTSVGSNWVNLVNADSPVGSWQHATSSLVAPAGTVTVTLYLQIGNYTSISGTAGGSAYVDDVQFGPTGTSTATLSAASVSNSGTITIGAGDTMNDAGGFVQSATGNLDALLGGPAAGDDYGQLIAAGSANLAGTFTASLVGGYAPSVNDGFTLVSYANETGSFATISLPSGTTYAFQSGLNPTYFGISAVPINLTTAVNTATSIATATDNLVGVNLAYWDDLLNTAQTQQMVQAAGLSLFRFPGGSASDDFHFNVSTNWTDPSANTIPEFARFITAAGGTGIVTVDYGSGSPQEAEAELAYLEGSPTDTTSIGAGIEWSDSANAWQTVNWQTVGYWASLRAALPLGTDDGLNFLRVDQAAAFSDIKYFEMGNEEYGSWEVDHHGTAGPGAVSTGSQHDPATYAAFTAAFLAFDANDTLLPKVAVGIDSGDPSGASDGNWTRNVITDLNTDGYAPGFISDHSYMYGPGSENDSFLLNDTVSDSSSLLDWSTRYADYESMLQQILGISRAAGVKVMATEFNSNYGTEGKQMTSIVNGIFVADSIGSLLNSGYTGGLVWDLRNGWTTDGNNSSTLYGWREGGDEGILGTNDPNSPPTTGPYIPYPTYFGEQLASKIMQSGGVDVQAVSNYGELTVYSVMEPDGHLDLMVLNKNPDASLTDQFSLSDFMPSGQSQVWQYAQAQDYAQSQSSTGAAALVNISPMINVSGGRFAYSFPAYSMTVIDLSPLAVQSGSGLTITLNNLAPVSITPSGGNIMVSEGGNQSTFSAITTVSVIGSTTNNTLNFNGSIAAALTFSNDATTTLNVNSGTITIAAGSGSTINTQLFSSVNIAAGASVVLSDAPSPAGRTLLETQYLTIAGTVGHWTGKLDLNNNDLDVQNGNITNITDQLKSGFNAGGPYWEGSDGIVSSAAASNGTHLTTLGGILNTVDGTSTGAALYGGGHPFDGVSPPASAVLVKYTYYGDANLDGKVDGSDYSRIDNGFLKSLTGWFNGDFNYDSVVNGSDYTLIDNAFNSQGAVLTDQLSDSLSARKSLPAIKSKSTFAGVAYASVVDSPGNFAVTTSGMSWVDKVLGDL